MGLPQQELASLDMVLPHLTHRQAITVQVIRALVTDPDLLLVNLKAIILLLLVV